ncbi:MAG: hypothetical protein ACI87E_004381 [Mariniblastus sp.]|jgi:hypothetical protein
MGEFRFRIPANMQLAPYHSNSIHVVGIDGIPWPCRISFVGDESATEAESAAHASRYICVSRNRDESGRVYFVYPLKNRGEMLICTGTLPVREKPYELLPELARGTLNRLRNQISIWEEGGLEIAASVNERVGIATHLLSQSILCIDLEQSDQAARDSIEQSMDAIFELSNSFGVQISRFRRDHDQLSNFWLANVTGHGDQFEASLTLPEFDVAQVCLTPDAVAQNPRLQAGGAENLGRRIVVGPWLDTSVGGLPQRLLDIKDTMDRKQQLLDDCKLQLESLPSTTSLIHVARGINGIGHRHLSYPNQLQTIIDILNLVEASQTKQPTMISFDFPWAERLAGAVGGIHPLQIADSLLRQGLPISFLGLDINLDYWPNGSAIRDPLQWIDLVDVWAQLGLPLVICLRMPTGSTQNDSKSVDREVNQSRSGLSDDQRIQFLETVLPMMVARPSVHGMIWSQWSDDDDKRFPHGGLVDANGEIKLPILETIRKMRAAIMG